jgi:ABC-type multidrug transport system ATPase subunit
MVARQRRKIRMITAEHLSKHYGSHVVLHEVSFQIPAGEAVALWGENGAGKTTTIRCMLGLHAFEGKLKVNGIDVQQDGKAARAAIGYVPQEVAFYDLSVRETLLFYARLKKVAPAQAFPLLEQVQLTAHEQKSVKALSGGLKQRLALAIALLGNPPILVLDEPTANLDVQAQRDFLHLIQELNQAGKTVVFSSHRLDEVQSLAQRVLVLANGTLHLDCAAHEVADRLGLRRWLRVWVAPQHKTQTTELFTAQQLRWIPNGRSVYVEVAAGGKMAVLRSLEAAHIPIQDFELVEGTLRPSEGSAS